MIPTFSLPRDQDYGSREWFEEPGEDADGFTEGPPMVFDPILDETEFQTDLTNLTYRRMQ